MNAVTIQDDNLVEQVMNAAQPLVLFRTSGMVMAAPLTQAYRFDELDYLAGSQTATYQGALLPVHSISKLATGRKPVIMFGNDNALEALVVDEILDIVAYNGMLPQTFQASAGAAMIRGQVTEIVNLNWFSTQKARAA